jgi:hypothetical protein
VSLRKNFSRYDIRLQWSRGTISLQYQPAWLVKGIWWLVTGLCNFHPPHFWGFFALSSQRLTAYLVQGIEYFSEFLALSHFPQFRLVRRQRASCLLTSQSHYHSAAVRLLNWALTAKRKPKGSPDLRALATSHLRGRNLGTWICVHISVVFMTVSSCDKQIK